MAGNVNEGRDAGRTPHFAFVRAVVAAILIAYGRMARRNRVAIAGFATLALAAVVCLLMRG